MVYLDNADKLAVAISLPTPMPVWGPANVMFSAYAPVTRHVKYESRSHFVLAELYGDDNFISREIRVVLPFIIIQAPTFLG